MSWIIHWIEKAHYQLYKKLGWTYLAQRHWHLHPKDDYIENSGWGVTQHVVPRRACLYQLFPLQDLPTASRADALNLSIQQWSPWEAINSWVVWCEQGAMVWIWEKPLVDFKSGYTVPETLLQSPATEGCYRVASSEGVELQVWKQGVLHHSFWKAGSFTSAEQKQWLALTGISQTTGWKVPESTGYLALPWAENAASTSLNTTYWIQKAVMAALFVLVFFSAILIAEWFQWNKAGKALETQHAALLVSLRPVLTERNNYQAALAKVNTLVELSPRRWQAGLFMEVLSALQAAECEPCSLVSWQYNGTQLELTVQANQLLEKKLVTSLNQSGRFNSINLTPIQGNRKRGKQGNKQMKISLTL